MFKIYLIFMLTYGYAAPQDYDYYTPFGNDTFIRIHGGNERAPFTYPSSVIVRRTSNHDGCKDKHCGICTGTVLNNQWILTAAHCCTTSTMGVPYELDIWDMSVQIAGNYDRSCEYSNLCNDDLSNQYTLEGFPIEIGVLRNVKKIEIHPSYRNPRSSYYPDDKHAFDYCLLQIEEIDFGAINVGEIKVAPVILPTSGQLPVSIGVSGEETDGQVQCEIVGWGAVGARGKQAAALLAADVGVMSQNYCNNLSSRTRNTFIRDMYTNVNDEYSFCAGSLTGSQDTCGGDSGGPVFCDVNGEMVQFGITSHGPKACGRGNPGVYMKVATAIPWIQEHTTDLVFISKGGKLFQKQFIDIADAMKPSTVATAVGEVEYEVTLRTMDVYYGGTDSDIYFQLDGELGRTEITGLLSRIKRGTEKSYQFTHADLGPISKVMIIKSDGDEMGLESFKIISRKGQLDEHVDYFTFNEWIGKRVLIGSKSDESRYPSHSQSYHSTWHRLNLFDALVAVHLKF